MAQEFIYNIEGFGMRSQATFGRYGFNIKLCSKFARRCLDKPVSPAIRQRFAEIAREMAAAAGERNPQAVRLELFEENLLFRTVNLGYDCSCLGLSYNQYESLKTGRLTPSVLEYTCHNVDHQPQASLILAIFLRWADLAPVILK